MKGKRYIDAAKQVNNSAYEVKDAISLACELAKAKFDETMELHVKLGVDPKQADQQVRGVLVLPHGTGRSQKVLVIAKGAKADEAAAAGADLWAPKKWSPKSRTKTGLVLTSASPPLT